MSTVPVDLGPDQFWPSLNGQAGSGAAPKKIKKM